MLAFADWYYDSGMWFVPPLLVIALRSLDIVGERMVDLIFCIGFIIYYMHDSRHGGVFDQAIDLVGMTVTAYFCARRGGPWWGDRFKRALKLVGAKARARLEKIKASMPKAHVPRLLPQPV